MKVSRITIGRLHNLGSYEHVRYEISVDVSEGESAAHALSNLEAILEALSPKRPSGVYDNQSLAAKRAEYETALKLTPEEFHARYFAYCPQDDARRIARLQEMKKAIQEAEARSAAWEARRERARRGLNDLGGQALYKDAKLDWQDDL